MVKPRPAASRMLAALLLATLVVLAAMLAVGISPGTAVRAGAAPGPGPVPIAAATPEVGGTAAAERIGDADRPSPDPTDLGVFLLKLVGTVVGLALVHRLMTAAAGLPSYRSSLVIVRLAAAGSLAVTLLGFLLVPESRGSAPQVWGILALHIVTVTSFAALGYAIIGRWAIPLTWFFFMVLGNSLTGELGGPAHLPRPVGLAAEWLPSAATADALWDASYLRDFRHGAALTVLGAWAAGLLVAWLLVAQRGRARPRPADSKVPASW